MMYTTENPDNTRATDFLPPDHALGRRSGRLVALAALLLWSAPGLAAIPDAGIVSLPWWLAGVLAVLILGTLIGLSRRSTRLQAEVEQQQRALACSAAEWDQAMDVLDDPMYLVDLNDRLIRANRAFYRQIGKSPEEALGCDVRELIHLKPEKKPCPACAARLEHRDAFFTKEADDPTNPTGRPIEVTVRVVRDAAGNPISILQGLRDLSHLRHTEEQLRKSQQTLANAQRIAHIGSWEWTPATDRVECSREARRLFCLGEQQELQLHHLISAVPSDDGSVFAERLRSAFASGTAFEMEHALNPIAGHNRVVRHRVEVILNKIGQPVAIAATVQDITAGKRAEIALFEEKEKAQVTLESIGDAVITTDVEGRIAYINPMAERMLNLNAKAHQGKPHHEVVQLYSSRTGEPTPDPLERCLNGQQQTVHEEHQILRCADGQEHAVDITATPIIGHDRATIGGVIVLHDVTEMHGMARKLSHQTTHDALTGLINRREFEFRLQQTIDTAGVDDSEHILLFMDIDNFKVVNDTCGHLAGDELLKQVADLFQTKLRNTDTLARLGGDEFAILLEGCTIAPARRIAETMRQAIKDFRFVWEGRQLSVGVSIGIVSITGDSRSTVETLRSADIACYLAKSAGRNRVHVYDPDDAAVSRRHGEMEWVNRINAALVENRFELHFQPIHALGANDGGRHYEILIRMIDETGQRVPPMAFIPAAERYQLMSAIDRWVVRESFRFFVEKNLGDMDPDSRIAINLSGQSLSDEHFLGFVSTELQNSGMAAERVCFEITETAAVANLGAATRFIAALREIGVHFALDDFGSGMSSFGYLKNLAVDYIKIDGAFVKDIVENPINYAMVSSINQIGQLMGIRTIAEFVENDLIMQKLRDLGVDFAQGYGIARPQPLASLPVQLQAEQVRQDSA